MNLLPIFLVGLAGSVHCIGMCGGIVSAFSTVPQPRPLPVTVIDAGAPRIADSLARVAAYNTGRIGSYAVAGALAGSVGRVASLAGAQMVLFVLANLMLAALGLHLMGVTRALARVEAAGQGLWRRLQPLTRRLMPLDSPAKLFALGGLWGWLPCGMVYSVLVTAMLSGSAASGASVMLAFGLGTLPMLLSLGLAGARLRTFLQTPLARRAAGLIVLAFAVLALSRVFTHQGIGWADALCVTP
jgi:sulfite exporter TauE/SafE